MLGSRFSRSVRFVAMPTIAAGLALGCGIAAAAPPSFETEDQELLYYWGTALAQQVIDAGITDEQSVEWVNKGLSDAAAGKSGQFGEEYRSLLNNYLIKRRKDAAELEAAAGRDFLQSLARQRGARTTSSGVVILVTKAGRGARPDQDAKVTVHYTGTLRDGQIFDSSKERGAPFETRLGSVIDCWAEAIPALKVGTQARIGCPPELAYGDRGSARIPGGSALVFDIELLGTED
jgi:FKBP-type peptidyl-prolyl cis-trans isomerase FkpA